MHAHSLYDTSVVSETLCLFPEMHCRGREHKQLGSPAFSAVADVFSEVSVEDEFCEEGGMNPLEPNVLAEYEDVRGTNTD